jgi:hypothetical protein
MARHPASPPPPREVELRLARLGGVWARLLDAEKMRKNERRGEPSGCLLFRLLN